MDFWTGCGLLVASTAAVGFGYYWYTTPPTVKPLDYEETKKRNDVPAMAVEEHNVPAVGVKEDEVPAVAVEEDSPSAAEELISVNLSGPTSVESIKIPEAPTGFIMLTISEFEFLQKELRTLKERIEEVVECGGDIAQSVQFKQNQTDNATLGLYKTIEDMKKEMLEQNQAIAEQKIQTEAYVLELVERIHTTNSVVEEHGTILSKLEWLHNPQRREGPSDE